MKQSKHIVLTVFGSLGDLHPMMALGIGLKGQGYRVTIATSEIYREKIEYEGLDFYALRPELDINNTQIFQDLFHPLQGPRRLVRDYMMPTVWQTYEDLRPLLETADFLVNSPLIFPGPVIARHLGLPWASVLLQPLGYFSAYDPPVIPFLPALEKIHHWPPAFWESFFSFANWTTRDWPRPIYDMQKQLGVADYGNPVFEGQFSPFLNLALFSQVLGKVQPDWPQNSHACGFAFYDRMKLGESQLPGPVRNFLQAGEAPLIFTLGSSTVKIPGDFYESAIQAAIHLGKRAICILGEHEPQVDLTPNILLWDALDYSQIFTYASAVIHQGGAGTTSQVLRAGKPMIIVPFGFDQQDNAARMKRLGVSRTVPKSECSVQRLTTELKTLLENETYAKAAMKAAQVVNNENAVETASDLIEATIQSVQSVKFIPTAGVK